MPISKTPRSDHVVLETGDGLVLTCGGEVGLFKTFIKSKSKSASMHCNGQAADGTDDFSCVSLDLTLGVASEQVLMIKL